MDHSKVMAFLGQFVADAAATGAAGQVAIGNRLGSTAGIGATRDEACVAVERAYETMKAAIRDPE